MNCFLSPLPTLLLMLRCLIFIWRSECWISFRVLTSIKVRCESRVHKHFSFPLPSLCPEPEASVLLPSLSNSQTQNDLKRERELWVLYDRRILSQIQKDSKHNFPSFSHFLSQQSNKREPEREKKEEKQPAENLTTVKSPSHGVPHYPILRYNIIIRLL